MTASAPIAVTGALGFVASHLIPRLLPEGRVIGVVRPGRDAARLERAGVEVRRADLDQPGDALAETFRGCERVVHLAGMAQAVRLVPALERAGVGRGVFVSSAGVYTRLVSPGADRKRAGEAALRESRLAWTILRPSMIYGTPADRNIVRLLRWLARSPVIFLPGGGRTLQQPVHVDDLVAAILAALERPAAAGREYDVGGPEPLSLRDLVRACAASLGRSPVVVPLPITPAHRLVVLLRRAGLPSPVSPEQVLRLTESKAVDIEPARRDLGFSPQSFAEGVAAEARMLRGSTATLSPAPIESR